MDEGKVVSRKPVVVRRHPAAVLDPVEEPFKGEEFKGDFYVVDVRAFQALTEAKRKSLLESGLIKIESEWSKPYYGQVTVELY